MTRIVSTWDIEAGAAPRTQLPFDASGSVFNASRSLPLAIIIIPFNLLAFIDRISWFNLGFN
jgi:hypothetical protein